MLIFPQIGKNLQRFKAVAVVALLSFNLVFAQFANAIHGYEHDNDHHDHHPHDDGFPEHPLQEHKHDNAHADLFSCESFFLFDGTLADSGSDYDFVYPIHWSYLYLPFGELKFTGQYFSLTFIRGPPQFL